ncbi:hypothetical protein USB125703_01467 [Pseudoclavibacter triregionum]|nr:hypothetical protein USB125703_01467 [Pseudoclavibacter triregionum]
MAAPSPTRSSAASPFGKSERPDPCERSGARSMTATSAPALANPAAAASPATPAPMTVTFISTPIPRPPRRPRGA